MNEELSVEKHSSTPSKTRRYMALVVVGILTGAYSVAEITISVKLDSIALLSDGVHNLSDVVSLIIALWALMKSTGSRTDLMTYGWRRTEILGAVMNGCFLVSLSLYIVLEVIPRFMKPQQMPNDWWFIGTAATGLGVNTIGTILFSLLSGGHGHSHAGGGGHGHSHGHSHNTEEEEEEDHSSKDNKQDKHEHSHKDKNHGHGHGHGHKKEKGHEDHGHSHKEKKKIKDISKSSDETQVLLQEDSEEYTSVLKSKYSHEKEEDEDEYSGEHHHESTEPKSTPPINTSSEDEILETITYENRGDYLVKVEKKKKKKKDMNIHAVFLHYLGDALSSILVLIAGLLGKYLNEDWTKYLDPACSLLIVLLILFTTIPMLKGCSQILLQQAPASLEVPNLKQQLTQIDGIQGVHDVHIWQLVDDLIIASLHISVYDADVPKLEIIFSKAKKVLHKFGIHSTTLQPEFIHRDESNPSCDQNCVKDCGEDWCCKPQNKLTATTAAAAAAAAATTATTTPTRYI